MAIGEAQNNGGSTVRVPTVVNAHVSPMMMGNCTHVVSVIHLGGAVCNVHLFRRHYYRSTKTASSSHTSRPGSQHPPSASSCNAHRRISLFLQLQVDRCRRLLLLLLLILPLLMLPLLLLLLLLLLLRGLEEGVVGVHRPDPAAQRGDGRGRRRACHGRGGCGRKLRVGQQLLDRRRRDPANNFVLKGSEPR